MLARILCGCSLLLLLNSTLLGEDKYDLHLHMRQGQSWSFNQVFDERQKSRLWVPDHPAVQTEQRTRAIRKGQMTVLAVTNGVPTAVRVAFDTACATEIDQDGTAHTVNFPFAGINVTIKRNALGQITEEFEPRIAIEPDPMQRRELEACLAGNEGRPAQPVSVGETWEPDLKQVKQAYQLTDQDRFVAFSKLLSITNLDGRRAAAVTNYTSVTSQQGEMTMTEETKGSLSLDLETGALSQSGFDGATSAKGIRVVKNLKGEETRVQVDNSGTSQMRLTTTPANVSTGATAQAQSPKPVNPLAANQPVTAPASKAYPQTWTGTYTDAQIVLELKPKDAGGYEGSILFKDQKFPLTAHDEEGQLKGQFRSGTEDFDFTATKAGNTVTLSTGGKTYQLKKQGLNPLGNGAQ